MYVYLVSYLSLLIYALGTTFFLQKKQTLSLTYTGFFLAILPALAFVVLRGDVGTDTGTYITMAQDLLSDPNASQADFDVEIGFYFLLRFLTLFMSDPRLMVNSISLFIGVYAYYLFSKKQHSIAIFCFLLFPMYFFDMSMNGLRYALAFLLAKHAYDKLEEGKTVSTGLLLIICISLQISGILVFLLMQMHKLRFRHAIYSIPFMVLFYYVFDERLLYKFAAYQDLLAPSATSGLLPLLIFFACYMVLILAKTSYAKRFFPIFLLEIASFMLTRVTYAGLRFQLLVLFAFFCCISVLEVDEFYRNRKKMYGLLILVGMLSFIGTVKHYVDDEGQPPTPFLPYQYFWEAK